MQSAAAGHMKELAAARRRLRGSLAERIAPEGPIPFAEFMRECLYHPEFGYYSRKEAQRFADFYTSVDVHPIFGRLLARQLAEMWEVLGRPAEFSAVEAAAGTGRLAAAGAGLCRSATWLVLRRIALRCRRAVGGAPRRARQDAGCASFSRARHLRRRASAGDSRRVHLLERTARCLACSPRGRPARRAAGSIRGLSRGRATLVEQLGPLSTPRIGTVLPRAGHHTREGQQAEAGLEACRWIEEAGKRLGRGFVLTVDYGREAAELYDERHMRGTLLAYSRHRASEDFLHAPGEQDLTAHVNFTALDLVGAPCRADAQRLRQSNAVSCRAGPSERIRRFV